MVDAGGSGKVHRIADGGDQVEGGLTGPSNQDWFTEEMAEAVAEVQLRNYEGQYNADHLTWRDFADDARDALSTIAPMVEKLLEMQSNGGYAAGFEKALSSVEEALEPYDDTWWVQNILNRVRDPE